jgi:type IV secretion system protein VirB6
MTVTVTLGGDPFTNWDSFIQTPFENGVEATLSSAIGALQGPVTALVVLFIIVSGILVMRGDVGVRSGITRIITVSLVVAIVLSVTTYNEYVAAFFVSGIPNFFATALSGGAATTEPATFFTMLQQVASVFNQADKGVGSLNLVGATILAILNVMAFIPIAILFMFYELTKILIELVVCLGPFVLPGYFFAATRGVADRFVGKLIGLTLLILLVDIALSIIDAGINEYGQSVLVSIASGQSSGWFGTSENIPATIYICVQLVVFLIVSVLVMTFLPGIASSIGGGVSVSPLAVANAVSNVASLAQGRGSGDGGTNGNSGGGGGGGSSSGGSGGSKAPKPA